MTSAMLDRLANVIEYIQMNETRLLLNLYYEILHEQLEVNMNFCTARMEKLLRVEITKQKFGEFDENKLAAYQDACHAFLLERIEMYNPIGVQYIFDKTTVQEAFKLELALNWYDSREEYEALIKAAWSKTEANASGTRMRELANDLIRELGAYPDKSIISDYEAEPTLNKLPDYVIARIIEKLIRSVE